MCWCLLLVLLLGLPLGLLEFPLLGYWETALLSSFTGLRQIVDRLFGPSTVTWFVVKSALATVASVAPA